MKTEPSLDCVFGRRPYWFLDPIFVQDTQIDWCQLLPVLTKAFNDGEAAFEKYEDSEMNSGLLFLAGPYGVGETIFFNDEVEFDLRSGFLLCHEVLFKNVVVPRARNPLSELNISCFSYWDSLIQYSGLHTSLIQEKRIFQSFHQVTYALFGVLPALDRGISRAFGRWFPDFLES